MLLRLNSVSTFSGQDHFRVYQIDRQKLPLLLEKIKEKGILLYLVDHRENTRTIYADI
jgi:hypothetical protein